MTTKTTSPLQHHTITTVTKPATTENQATRPHPLPAAKTSHHQQPSDSAKHRTTELR
ncbi:hypothetical protein A2U01_0073972, partial [Trifolium medium]|nr:hypothetical protein [Trifolium medium]